MFWTIVVALIFVFFILPLILEVVLGILGALFDEDGIVGYVILIVVFIILLVIIF